ncbi:MAG: reverse transcriptase family protein [Candidatus Thiodiazotropha endolucinida]|nr:reverse transcriptase family protein [Candidatus Thiodiazotropha taylori]MCW4260128.1 reverse transcriptase family protein [Candidatus Thiodiazotropha endolucinida]
MATEAICNDASEIDSKVNLLTDIIYNACFSVCGKSVRIKSQGTCTNEHKKAVWFNQECRDKKTAFLNAKRCFRILNSDSNRTAFLESRSDFLRTKKRAKIKYQNEQKSKLANMSKTAPKQFWKNVNKFRNKKSSASGDLTIGEFQEHFNRIMNSSNNDENMNFFNIPNLNVQVEDLDKPITEAEVQNVIRSLKRGKSPGFDGILNDFFLDTTTFISPYLVKIYNKIFDSGTYPESWCKGLIVPIHKKGDKNDTNNYRGIMLISTIAKLFSLILRNRLNSWCENNDKFTDFQFGFRDGRNTSDCIFILHSLVQRILKDNAKLFCAFIDYEKAFDTVNRDALWFKLMDHGVSSKLITVLKSIYQKVIAAVKMQSDLSSFFEIALGVKQGEPLSPLLFILFVNDVYSDLLVRDDQGDVLGVGINELCFFLLLFADDMVLFSKDPVELQLLLDRLHRYSYEWGLKVNTQKTKVCVFENRRTQRNNVWLYDGVPLEIVDSFTYLGMKFKFNGNLEDGIKALSDQAMKATNQLLALFKRMNFDVKTKLKLFDSLISPILLYASEVWGIYGYDHIDKVHIKFCKKLLGVRTQTPNYAVYGDLGRFPLSVIAKERSVKYWLRILTNKNSLMYKIFHSQVDEISPQAESNRFRYKRYWAEGIRNLLDSLGFSNFWMTQEVDIPSYQLIKNRIRDNFTQSWYARISNTSKLEYYCQFKTEFKFEKYVDCIKNDRQRSELAAFRLSAHNLDIERGRHIAVTRENRICRLCSMGMIESEYHFLLVCPLYQELRRELLKTTSWPSVTKFISIMSSNSGRYLVKIAQFIMSANVLRTQALLA